MKRKPKTIKFRRKREGKTNYTKRIKLLKSPNPRAVIRGSLSNMTVQIITYNEKGDKVLASASSKELQKTYGLKAHRGNIPSAYLTGLLCGKKAKENKVKIVVTDIGMNVSVKGSKLYAAIKGLKEAGIEINCTEEVMPSEERIMGKDIENYAKQLKENKEAYEKQFSSYLKNGLNPEELSKNVEEVKNKIAGK